MGGGDPSLCLSVENQVCDLLDLVVVLLLVELSKGDHLRIPNHGLGIAVEHVKDLALVTFPHNGLDQGGGDCGDSMGAQVATELLGEDLDCLLEGHRVAPFG